MSSHGDLSDARAVESLLRERGIRVTAPRVAVLRAVHEHPHAEVDALARSVRDRLGAVSTQAVYDTLALFSEEGLVRRLSAGGSPARFETRVGDNHHHVVCRTCGAMADVDCALPPAPCLEPSQTNGFLVDEAEVTFRGLCPRCRTAGS